MPKINANQIIGKAVKIADELAGHSARKYSATSQALKGAKNLGIKGIKPSTIRQADKLSTVANGRSFQTRVKTGLGAAAVLGGGFLGLHKYHQHKDNKILERIDKMYKVK